MDKFKELFELTVTDEEVAKEFILALENKRLSEFAGKYGVTATEKETFQGLQALIIGEEKLSFDDNLNASTQLRTLNISSKTDIMANLLSELSKKK